jgi:hypothetical protein
MPVMRKGETTIAFKAIALSNLSSAHKRVAAAVLDHYNRISGRCDPSMQTLSTLLSMSRRTVIRAIHVLVHEGYFERDRHGGNHHCNQYIPVWSRFRTAEAAWQSSREAHRGRFDRRKASPPSCPAGHVAGDRGVTQTCPETPSQETFNQQRHQALEPREKIAPTLGQTIERWSSVGRQQACKGRKSSGGDVARDVAERRWVTALMDRYSADAQLHARIIEFVDDALSLRATESELARTGAGLELILDALICAGIVQRHGAPG